jgi:hypothetical protein
MTQLTAEKLLELWEKGESPAGHLLGPEGAECSLGERQRRLLRMGAELTGPVLQGTAVCSRCGETLDLEVPVAALAGQDSVRPSALECEGVRVRVPGAAEVERAMAMAKSPAEARERLLELCTGERALPAATVAKVEWWLEQADPLAVTELTATCPQCAAAMEVPFDAGVFVEAALRGRAERLLGEVNLLASTYGWAERDILGMSAVRRQAYVSLIAG